VTFLSLAVQTLTSLSLYCQLYANCFYSLIAGIGIAQR
jgi:hypothetical protein